MDPSEAMAEAFRKAMGQYWSEAANMLVAILIVLAFCTVLATFIEWKLCKV